MRFVIIVIAMPFLGLAILSGCETGIDMQERIFNETHVPERRTSTCIMTHLESMSESDHVASWNVDLYKAVAKECEKLYLKEDR